MVKLGGQGFPRSYRIVRRSDYRVLYEHGQKLHSQSFVLFGRPNPVGHHRLGVTVSRKVGGAVARNRAKRLFREVFRKSHAEIPYHFDFVINARRECVGATYGALRCEFVGAATRLVERASRRDPAATVDSDEGPHSVPPAGV